MSGLPALLETSVPLRMYEMQRKGGPDDLDIERAQSFADDLAAHGDVLLYGGEKPGEAARLANDLAHAIAVLAFQPGGVTVFGWHFEAKGERQ